MSDCLRSGLVELTVLLQAQHINNRKYSNSYTINDVCRQTIVYRHCNVKETISIPHENDMQIF